MQLNVVLFRTIFEKARGLQYLPTIQDHTLYVFTSVQAGEVFHSRNVVEPFDLAFLDGDHKVLAVGMVTPPRQGATAPPGTQMAIEMKAGRAEEWGVVPGNQFIFS